MNTAINVNELFCYWYHPHPQYFPRLLHVRKDNVSFDPLELATTCTDTTQRTVNYIAILYANTYTGGIQCGVLRYSVLLILLQNALISAYSNIAISEMCLTVRCIWCVLYLEYTTCIPALSSRYMCICSTMCEYGTCMYKNLTYMYMYLQDTTIVLYQRVSRLSM